MVRMRVREREASKLKSFPECKDLIYTNRHETRSYTYINSSSFLSSSSSFFVSFSSFSFLSFRRCCCCFAAYLSVCVCVCMLVFRRHFFRVSFTRSFALDCSNRLLWDLLLLFSFIIFFSFSLFDLNVFFFLFSSNARTFWSLAERLAHIALYRTSFSIPNI